MKKILKSMLGNRIVMALAIITVITASVAVGVKIGSQKTNSKPASEEASQEESSEVSVKEIPQEVAEAENPPEQTPEDESTDVGSEDEEIMEKEPEKELVEEPEEEVEKPVISNPTNRRKPYIPKKTEEVIPVVAIDKTEGKPTDVPSTGNHPTGGESSDTNNGDHSNDSNEGNGNGDNGSQQPNPPAVKQHTLTVYVEPWGTGVMQVKDGNGNILLKEIHNYQSVSFTEGAKLVTTVTPEDGYVLVGWKVDDSEEIINADGKNFYVLENQKKDVKVTAVLEKLSHLTVETTGAGTASLDKEFVRKGDSATLTVEPHEDSEILSITLDGSTLKIEDLVNGKYTFNATKDHHFVVNFTAKKYRVTTKVEGKGTFNVSKKVVEANETLEMTSEPENGWKFKEYTVDGKTISTKAHDTYKVTNNVTITSVFEQLFNITAEDVVGAKVVLSHKQAVAGTGVFAVAIPNPGYELVGWEVNGERFGATNPLIVIAKSDVNFKPIVRKIPLKYYSVTVDTVEGGMGKVSKTSAVSGEEATFEVTDIEDGYEFSKWEFSDGTESTEATCKKVIEADITGKPVFVKKQYPVTLGANIEGADVSFSEYEGTSATVEHGGLVTANAPLVVNGNKFSHFEITKGEEKEEVTESKVEVEITAETKIMAIYKVTKTLTVEIIGDGTVTTTQDGKTVTFDKDNQTIELPFGSHELLSHPGEGSYLVSWAEDAAGNKVLGNSEKYQVELSNNKKLYVIFAKKDSTVKVNYLAKDGTVLKTGAVERGKALEPSTNVTLSGMTFIGWTIENGGFYEKVASSNDFVLKGGTETLTEALERLTADESVQEVKIKATYVEEQSYYSLVVELPGKLVKTDKEKTDKGYPAKTHYYVDVEEDQIPEGEKFSTWEKVNLDGTTEILSYQKEFDAYLLGDMTLKPTFSEEETEAKPVVAITSHVVDNEDHVVTTNMKLELPAVYRTVFSWGYMYQTKDESLEWSEKAENKVEIDKTYREYTYDFKNYDWFVNENTVTLRPFAVIAKSDSSKPEVVYGETKSIQCKAKEYIVTVDKATTADVEITLGGKTLEFSENGTCEVPFKYGSRHEIEVNEDDLQINGMAFWYWRKDYPDKKPAANTSNPHTITVASDMKVTLVCKEVVNNISEEEITSATVTFVADTGETLKSETVKAGKTVELPKIVEKSGKTVVGWTLNGTLFKGAASDEEFYSSDGKALSEAIRDITATGQNVQVVATYQSLYHNLTVTGGTITNVEGKQENGKYETSAHIFVTVDKATVPEGQVCVGWKLNGTQISNEESCDFYIVNDSTLEAIYENKEAQTETTTKEVLLSIPVFDVKEKTASFLATVNVPEGMEVQQVVLRISNGSETEDIPCPSTENLFDWNASFQKEDWFNKGGELCAQLWATVDGNTFSSESVSVIYGSTEEEIPSGTEGKQTTGSIEGETPSESGDATGSMEGETPSESGDATGSMEGETPSESGDATGSMEGETPSESGDATGSMEGEISSESGDATGSMEGEISSESGDATGSMEAETPSESGQTTGSTEEENPSESGDCATETDELVA